MNSSDSTHAFDLATTLIPGPEPSSFLAELDATWSISGKMHGGYLLSVMGRAAMMVADHPHPVAASAHYLRAPDPGKAVVRTQVLRAGRSTTVVRVGLEADGGVCAEAHITCGGLDGDVTFDGVPAVTLPPEEDCFLLPVEAPGFTVSLMSVLAERMDPACMGWALGEPTGRGELAGWVRFVDGRAVDPLGLLTIVDALPAATFDLGLSGWVPTLELTAHIRAVPAPGPLAVRQVARHVASERVDEICDVWDSTGRLVATGHQLAGVRTTS